MKLEEFKSDEFLDQVVIITGAGSGIGLAAARAFATRGAVVIALDLDIRAVVDVGATIGERSSGIIVAQKLDVRHVKRAQQAIAKIWKSYGRIDVLINNAGITKALEFFEVTPEDWDSINAVNSRGTFFFLQNVARYMMQQQSGTIINTASIGGKGFRGTTNVAYAASKGSILTFTRVAALALASSNIRVNAICPGVVSTRMRDLVIENMMARRNISWDEAALAQITTIPLGRVTTVDEVAAAIMFFASSAANTITGQLLDIDGGLML